MIDRNYWRGRCRLLVYLPAKRATERCAAIVVKDAKGWLAQGGHLLATVLKARYEPEKIAFATLDSLVTFF